MAVNQGEWRMSGRVLVLAALLIVGTSAAATARPANLAVFSCKLPGGRTVTVTGGGERFVYRYGTAKKAS